MPARRGSAKSTRDLLSAAVDRLPDEQVAELYEYVRRLEVPAPPDLPAPADGMSPMAALRAIKIDGLPADFSENLHHGKPIDPTPAPSPAP